MRFALFVLCVISTPLFAGVGGRSGPLNLEQADILRNVTRENEQIRILVNNVKFSQQDVKVTCDYAEFYSTSRKAYFRGKVIVVDSVKTLSADEVIYEEASGVANAIGNVIVSGTDGRVLRCRRLDYNYDTGVSTYRGEVSISDSVRRTLVTGDLGTYDEVSHIADITVVPVMIKRDSTNQHPITIKGRRLWVNDSVRTARVEQDVSVVQDTMVATGNDLWFDDSTGLAVLWNSPKVTRGKETMTADSMRFLFKDDRIERMYAFENVETLSPADSLPNAPLNKVTGRELISYFANGEPQEIHVSGNARSRYYIRDKGKSNGVNVASGDTLRILFERKEMQRIFVIGGVEGTYYPPKWTKEIP